MPLILNLYNYKMDSSLTVRYTQLSKDIDDYVKANDLDIILTRIRTLMDEVLAKISTKLKKNIEEV